MNIKSTDLVLEIGSGNNPNPRSDILCDRYLTDDSERAGGFKIRVDRPFIVCDGYHLPFADHTFDYVICSHILEHMDEADLFLKEIARVAKAGYIEVPRDISERLFGWPFHDWICEWTKKGITLRKKHTGVQYGGIFHRLIASDIWFRRWFESYEEYMYIKYEWVKKPNVRVIKKEADRKYIDSLDMHISQLLESAGRNNSQDQKFYIQWILRRIKRKLKKEIKKILFELNQAFLPHSFDAVYERVLVCPNCRFTLTHIRQEFRCTHCHRVYPVEDEIPILLSSTERKKGY